MKHDLRTLAWPSFSSRTAPASSTRIDRWALRKIQLGLGEAPIRIALWDGFAWPEAARPLVATVEIKNRRALFSWLRNPDLNFGEAFMFGAIEVHGDLAAMLEAAYRAMPAPVVRPWSRWQPQNGMQAARANVHSHYDLGNDFYALWLDREMVYTCAYFPTPASTLEEAQGAKMERICRKLHLKHGERVVEAGCGWGALALHMAKNHGVSVRAFNVSAEQIAYARERAAEQGLTRQVEFIEDDYRNVRGEYDAFVSVGMLEHVGLRDFATFGRVIDRSLAPNGRGLVHFIGRNQALPLNAWIRKRIFPGAYPPTLGEVSARVFEPYGFSVLDVENLRLHYATTLMHWTERFNAAAARVEQMFDAAFVRAWRLYLAGSQASFATGYTQLFQVGFARGTTNQIPWTRGPA
jgi:cyclopropane-fatty-acyl-phospholipid synthase